ncbi:MAG: DUF1566 domain-containing protein [Gammaproteobacteria bacterium]|nr:DUF1566 domain-containing protein [Gammaproteobacteria bacterium]
MLYKLIAALPIVLLGACGGKTSGLPPLTDDRYELRNDGDCVLDTGTSLLWERKSGEPGLRNWHDTYSWFDPTSSNGEIDYRGTEDGGSCKQGSCDTWHFVEAINEAKLCGYSDWRLPDRDELYSISDLSKSASPPTINAFAFPFTHADEYWSDNDYSFQPDSAWTWSFQYGHDRVDWKKEAKFVRLVRGTASALTPVQE